MYYDNEVDQLGYNAPRHPPALFFNFRECCPTSSYPFSVFFFGKNMFKIKYFIIAYILLIILIKFLLVKSNRPAIDYFFFNYI